MQFTTVLVTLFLSLGLTATANPTIPAGEIISPASPQAQSTTPHGYKTKGRNSKKQVCAPEQEAACCEDVTKLGLFEIVGVNCLQIPLGGCSQKTACCSKETAQVGAVNLNLDCNAIL